MKPPQAGCETMKPPQVELAQPRLVVAMQKDRHPNLGDKFVHDGSRIVVFQVLQPEGFVLAHKEIDLTNAGSVLDRGLTIRVDTTDDYVTDELLRPGVYEYVGVYTYETVNKVSSTVRMFKRVSDK